MSQLNGVWKYKSSENFDEYMKALGVNVATRKMGNLAKPTVTIEINGDSFLLKSESTFRNLKTKCNINEEWDEETADGRKCKTLLSWDGDKLVHVQKWKGKETKIIRYVDSNGHLIMECTMGDVKSTRAYEKA